MLGICSVLFFFLREKKLLLAGLDKGRTMSMLIKSCHGFRHVSYYFPVPFTWNLERIQVLLV
jgi:hypothetical protein